jgi:hypothetical protein
VSLCVGHQYQILLIFLYGEAYRALVYVSNGSGDSHMAILKLFTVPSTTRFWCNSCKTCFTSIGGGTIKRFGRL